MSRACYSTPQPHITATYVKKKTHIHTQKRPKNIKNRPINEALVAVWRAYFYFYFDLHFDCYIYFYFDFNFYWTPCYIYTHHNTNCQIRLALWYQGPIYTSIPISISTSISISIGPLVVSAHITIQISRSAVLYSTKDLYFCSDFYFDFYFYWTPCYNRIRRNVDFQIHRAAGLLARLQLCPLRGRL